MKRDDSEVHYDLTHYRQIEHTIEFDKEDLVFVGVPVYAGRVPNFLLKTFNFLSGNGALAVPIVVYGNRHYDDALLELSHMLSRQGFRVFAAGTFIGEHAFSNEIAKGRPDRYDTKSMRRFSEQIAVFLNRNENELSLLFSKLSLSLLSPFSSDSSDKTHEWIPGQYPYRAYYQPLDIYNQPYDFKKIKPVTDLTKCSACMICVDICPTCAISSQDVSEVDGICIKCCACIKKCPESAKSFSDENFVKHRNELECDCVMRKEPECFFMDNE